MNSSADAQAKTPPAYLRAERLAREGFAHGFSTRHADLAQVDRFLGRPGLPVHRVNQVHGAEVLVVGSDPATTVACSADALVALRARVREPIAVSVRVADCVPVLVGDPTTGDVAAVHAGWRGIVAGVIPAACARMQPGPKVVAIGPCIGPCCFEVGHDVAESMVAAAGPVIDRHVGPKAFVHLRKAVRAQLSAAGIEDEAIEDLDVCTFCATDTFFSYRRDRGQTGRQIGVIATRS